MQKIISLFILIIFCINFALPCYAAKNDTYLQIDKKSEHLGSRLHKEYVGYVYTITNNSQQDIIIDQVIIDGSTTSKAAYNVISRSSLGTGAATLARGVVLALPTLTLSLIYAVIAAPVKMIANTCGNIGASSESKRYDKRIKDNYILKSQEKVEIKTLVPKHTDATITVLYQSPDGNGLTKLNY